MKASEHKCLTRLMVSIAVFALTLTFVIPAGASSSIVRPYIGYTKIQLSDEFVAKLVEANITSVGIKPGYLDLKRKVAVLPIVGGLVDLVNLDVEIYHTGGVSFNGSDGNNVPIYNFMISNLLLQDFPFPMFDFEPFPTTMTGLVVFGGDMIEARDPLTSLFIVDIKEENVTVKYNTLIISDVQVTLDALAFILNGLSGPELANFEPGDLVGVARVYARFYGGHKHRFRMHEYHK